MLVMGRPGLERPPGSGEAIVVDGPVPQVSSLDLEALVHLGDGGVVLSPLAVLCSSIDYRCSCWAESVQLVEVK